MVSPIVSGAAMAAVAPIAQETERPVAAQAQAVQVTPAGDTRSAGWQGRHPEGQAGQQGGEGDALQNALAALNHNMEAWSTDMRFDIDEDTQRVVVSIVDRNSGEVLRTVPSDAVIRVAKMIVQLQGNGVDTRA